MVFHTNIHRELAASFTEAIASSHVLASCAATAAALAASVQPQSSPLISCMVSASCLASPNVIPNTVSKFMISSMYLPNPLSAFIITSFESHWELSVEAKFLVLTSSNCFFASVTVRKYSTPVSSSTYLSSVPSASPASINAEVKAVPVILAVLNHFQLLFAKYPCAIPPTRPDRACCAFPAFTPIRAAAALKPSNALVESDKSKS